MPVGGATRSPTSGAPAAVDVIDRAARLLGIVYGNLAQLQQLTPADALANPANLLGVGAFPHIWNAAAAQWNRLRQGAAIGQALVDPADRWARQVGQVDLARVLGAALTSANPVIAGIFDAVGNRMPSMDVAARPGFVDVIDRTARLVGVVYGNQGQLQQNAVTLELITDMVDRAARLVGIVYGEAAQLQQLTPADGVIPNLSLETSAFPHVYDPVAGDWNRWREGAAIGQGLVDIADRWARLLGQIDLARYGGAAVGPANPVDTEEVSPTSVAGGQVTLTGGADQLPNVPCKSITIENPTTNAVVYVDNAAVAVGTSYRLQPGATVSMDIDNANRIYVLGTAAQTVTYITVN